MSTMVLPVTGVGPVLGTGFVSGVCGAVALATSAVTLATKADAAGLELDAELAAELADEPPALLVLEPQAVRSSATTPRAATVVTRRLLGAIRTKRVMFRNLLRPESERSPMDTTPGL
jgi:hypothetical protein